MSDSTTLIDTIASGQLQPETTANQYFDAASPATLFGRRGSATSFLTWAYYGGTLLVDGVLTGVDNDEVTLTASQTNYVEATRAGVVSVNTTGFTAGRIPLYIVTTNTTAATSYTDERTWVDPHHMTHQASVSITTADVTLTAAQARCNIIVLSGTLTGNRNLIVPNNWQGTVINSTSGSYTVTVKTSAGTGVTVTQSSAAVVAADGTNVVKVAEPAVSASNTFSTIAVSGQSNVVADSTTDTLTLAAGSGITITTDAATDTVTITNSGSASNSFETIAVSGQSNVVADSGTDTLTFVAGSGITITTDAATDSITITATGAAPTQCIPIACSDETTALTTGTAKVTFRMPYAFTLTAVRASVTTAPTGATLTVDINEGGVSILSTKLTIDASEKTSTTAATAAVISDTSLADDAEITIDIDQIGSTIAGAGLKVYLIGTKA